MHSEDRRKTGRRTIGMVLFLLTLLPGLLGVTSVRISAQAAEGSAVLDGSWSAIFEETFAREHLVRDAAVTAVAALRYGIFREGRKGVLVGEENWLFTAEEYQEPAEETAVTLDQMAAVARRLEDHGIPLIVALLPAKARMYRDVAPHRLPPDRELRYEAVLEFLAERGIAAPDLRSALTPTNAGAPTFFATDTHWTPLGAAAAAAAISSTWSAISRSELPQAAFDVVDEKEVTFDGDLVSFLNLGRLRRRLGPPAEHAVVRELDTSSSQSAGLFGELSIPVTVVGTSYTAEPRWGFASALKLALGSDVLTVASEGAGPFAPMESYLAGDTIQEIPPKLVIWEVPERYVRTN